MSDAARKLQRVIDSQIGKSGVYSFVAAVQSVDRRIEFTGAGGLALGSELPSVWPVPVAATALWIVVMTAVALWRFGREEF